MRTFILVYQAGIANVFEVQHAQLRAADRGVTTRKCQGDFHTAASIARGALMAGADVRTACCNRAGDITNADWSCDYDEQPFSDQYVLVGGVV